jgi:regulator of replication initiation timing
MSTSNSNGFKALLAVLVLILLGLGYFTYDLYGEKKENEQKLIEEKQLVMENLTDMASKYDQANKENTVVNERLVDAQQRIESLIDSLKTSENNVDVLMKYKRRYQSLQKEMDFLMAENDSLRVSNMRLSSSLDSTQVQLAERTAFSDSLLVQNSNLAQVVKDASKLSAVSLKSYGVIVRNSGKLVNTDKARRADKIRVCFTVPKNNLVDAGDKGLYVQVIDPKNNVLGDNEMVSFDSGKTLNYSLISKFNYEKISLDICEFIPPKGDKFEKGTYAVNVFNGENLVATSTVTLE